jgi:hypothetical protein
MKINNNRRLVSIVFSLFFVGDKKVNTLPVLFNYYAILEKTLSMEDSSFSCREESSKRKLSACMPTLH